MLSCLHSSVRMCKKLLFFIKFESLISRPPSALGLGWPKWWNYCIRNMWLYRRAFRHHNVACDQRLWEKPFFWRWEILFLLYSILLPITIQILLYWTFIDIVFHTACVNNFTGSNSGPMLPSLSAQLCSGNGEFLKLAEENGASSEVTCLRRQELH